MDKLYQYIERMVWTSTNEETTRLLSIRKPTKKRTINVFIFVFFIIAITFYATLSLLLMSVVVLLFIYWILQVQVLSVRRLKTNPETRSALYFNQVQKLIQRRKYDEARHTFLQYNMRHEDPDNILLYIVTLFLNHQWDDLIRELETYPTDNPDIVLCYKYSLFYTKQYDKLQPMLSDDEIDKVMRSVILDKPIDVLTIHDPDLRRIAEQLT